jgi:hypothetical protein
MNELMRLKLFFLLINKNFIFKLKGLNIAFMGREDPIELYKY